MKFLFVFAAVLAVAVAAPQYMESTVVEGAKAILSGPSATIHADTGSVVKTPDMIARSMPVMTKWVAPTVAKSWVVDPTLDIMPKSWVTDPTLLGTRSWVGWV